MSAAAINFDLRSFLSQIVAHKAQTLSADLAHLPADKLGVVPMGVARTPIEFTAECIGFNNLVASAFEGKPSVRPPKDEVDAFFASFDTLEKAQHGLTTSAAVIVESLRKANESTLEMEVTAPWGETMPLYKLAYAAADHMTYHDGQINYIQSLYGDAENHWG